MTRLLEWFLQRPWLLVVLAFLLVIGAWTFLIRLASEHSPEVIELPSARIHQKS